MLKANSCQCFKCHGYEHIDLECSNHIILTLVEEENDKESEVDVQGSFETQIEEEEVMYENQEESLVIQRSSSVVHEEWVDQLKKKNIFDTRCTSKGQGL